MVMRRILYFIVLAAAFASSCTEKGRQEPETSLPDSLFGDYSGTVVVKSGKDTVVSDLPLRISVSAGQSESTMTITTNPISIAGVEAVSSLKFEDCMVLSYDGAYMFSYESESMNVGVLGDASVIFTGILSLDGNIDSEISITSASAGFDVDFSGHKMTGEESSDALITDFRFENSDVTSAVATIDNEKGTVVFMVGDDVTDEQLSSLAPTIKVSEGAAVSPASGVPQDFSAGKKVTYMVTAENGSSKVYSAYVGGRLSSACDITGFEFENGDGIASVSINKDEFSVTFVAEENADLSALVPVITVSDKATIDPASGAAQDFSGGKRVEYTVTAESGAVKVWSVYQEGSLKIVSFPFEAWSKDSNGYPLEPADKIWSSSASGAAILGGTLSEKIAEGYVGNCAKVTTLEYEGTPSSLIPKITSGSIYIGDFNLGAAFTDRLKCTEFGKPAVSVGITSKPLKFRGYYKYMPGETYLDASDYENIETLDKKDECSLSAVLYKAKDDSGNEIVLTGHDISSSEYIVAIAALGDGTEKTDWTYFDLDFVYNVEYDPAAEYKFTIVSSSSKDGNIFNGAGGSALYMDEFEIVCE